MLSDRINKLNAKVNEHLDRQRSNPFSGNFDRSRSPSPRPSDPGYGRPVAGSKTEQRGQKAKTHVTKEILELCGCIHDLAVYNAELRSREPQDEEDVPQDCEGQDIVTFGELFQIYSSINNKVVGLLIAAKKRGLVYFEKEILFQRRDDDVLVGLTKPIEEINQILKKELGEDDVFRDISPGNDNGRGSAAPSSNFLQVPH